MKGYYVCHLYQGAKTIILSLRVSPHLQAYGVDIQQVVLLPLLPAPSWTLSVPEICLDLIAFRKGDTRDLIFL